MSEQVRVKIGDIVIALSSDSSNGFKLLEDHYQRFLTEETPQVMLHLHYADFPATPPGENIFQSGGVWSLYRHNHRWIVDLQYHVVEQEPHQRVIFDDDFRRGDIYIRENPAVPQPTQFSFGFPLSEVLMVNLLSKGRGALLHASAIKYGDQGFLFIGTSGAGKSTTANLWRERRDTRLLSDDRVIVRQHQDGHFWIYGTPWHGDAGVSSPESAPLERIFFLKQAPINQADPLEQPEALSRMLVCTFPTYWDAQGMDFTLHFLSGLIQAVPCFELSFTPDSSAVDFVQNLKLPETDHN